MESELKYIGLEMGGVYNKIGQSAQGGKVAIVVPYRNRPRNLKTFLRYMHAFLAKQNLFNYGIFIVEPLEGLVFNRALIINVGFLEALKTDPGYDCFIYHDVDMLPENDNNLYQCHPLYPKQFAITISIYNYSFVFNLLYLFNYFIFYGSKYNLRNEN
jgi:hypothetical protein